MEIYTVKASQKKLKYHEEQIHFMLDGKPAYNWRNIQKEIKELANLTSMPADLSFITDKISFSQLDTFSWLKSGFRLPIFHNDFVKFLSNEGALKFETYPIMIQNKRNEEERNYNFVAFYLREYLDCVDKALSPIREYGEQALYEYRTAKFNADIVYPPLFKIKDISTPYMHFVNKTYKEKMEDIHFQGIDFQAVN